MKPYDKDEVKRSGYLRPADLAPSLAGTTRAKDPNAPLWDVLIHLENQCPLKEHIRAETKAAAKHYVLNKYNQVRSVVILGQVTGL